MIKVGLTGNIGTGKSTVSRIFEALGVPVYNADKEAKKLLEKESVKKELFSKFGEDIFNNGDVDRNKLAHQVFKDAEKLNFLNSIIHPMVKKDLEHFFTHNKHLPYVIQEAAILFESGFYQNFDKVIMVTSNESLANQRVVKRDNISVEEIEQRRSNQWSQDKKTKLSDFIIENNENDLVIPQVLEIHKILLNKK